MLPDICKVLILISACPRGDAVAEHGLLLMNLIMNDLRSSKNVRTLDATMRIPDQGKSLTNGEVDEITDVWKRHRNRQITL